MSWSGSACCVSCDPVHWKANNLSSPAFCSSHRTAITVTTPKPTSQQPNLADFNRNPQDSSCDQITHSQKYSGPNTFSLFSIVILLIVRVSQKSQNSCIGYATEMTWFAPLTETDWVKVLFQDCSGGFHLMLTNDSWNHRNLFSVIQASWLQ